MSKEILSHTVSVHQVTNPPATGRSTQANINFINLAHLQISDWRDDEVSESCFTLKIINPKGIGLESSEQANIEKFFDNILLSCNLTLKRAAFSKHTFDASDTKGGFQDNNLASPQSLVTKKSEGLRVELHENIIVRDSVHINVGFHDDLDEVEVLQAIKRIDSLYKISKAPPEERQKTNRYLFINWSSCYC